jgi:hypothetical protein
MNKYYLIFYRPIGSKCWEQWLGTDHAPFITAFADTAWAEIKRLKQNTTGLEFTMFECREVDA